MGNIQKANHNNILTISGTGKNVGKTSLACRIIHRLSATHKLTAVKISPHFHWIENGPVQNFFEQKIQADFWKSRFVGPGEIRLLANGMLSKESNETMQKHISRLKQQFSQLSEQDQHLKMQQRHGTTMLIGMRPWEMELFAKLRRYQNIKLYK